MYALIISYLIANVNSAYVFSKNIESKCKIVYDRGSCTRDIKKGGDMRFRKRIISIRKQVGKAKFFPVFLFKKDFIDLLKGRALSFAPFLALVMVFAAAIAFSTSNESRAQASTLPAWTCTTDAYLFQYPDQIDTTVTAVDLVTGGTDDILTIDRRFNAVGYNVIDNYVYGMKLPHPNEAQTLARIGSDGSWEPVSIPGFTGAGNLTGDVDENGHYWVTGNAVDGAPWAQINLNNNTLVASGTMSGLAGYGSGADWSYVPGGGNNLYRVASRDGEGWLVAFNRTTKQNTVLGSVGPMGTIGATYADGDGNLYAQENGDGEIHRIDVNAVTSTKFSDGPISASNDGTMCANARILTDYGDAPAGYGTLLENDGPRHVIRNYNEGANTAPIMLGSSIDAEDNGFPSAGADGDDTNNIDDEDGVANPIELYAGVPTDVEVSATNNTNEDVTLAGWIDLNNNGIFETSERVTVVVPANSGTQNYTLNFPAGTTSDDTYARFRIFGSIVADPQPIGSANNGEVEDYPVQAAEVTYAKSVSPDDAAVLTPGQTFTYTLTAENTGSLPLTGLNMTDDLSNVVDDATYNTDVSADIGTATFNAPDEIAWSGDLAVGETATITYTVTVNDPISGDGVLINGIVGDGPGSNCSDDPADDIECLTRVPQPDISSSKEILSPTGNPGPGDTVTYRFTIVNDGAAAATGVTVGDNLSGVLDDATYNNDATASTGTTSYHGATQRLTWNGDLAASGSAGDTVTVDYSVTINAATGLGDGVLQNGLLSADCPNPPIYDPGDANYNADCVSVRAIEAWTTQKVASSSGNLIPGETITYTVTAENTGGADLAGLSFTDDLTNVIDDAVYNNDGNADVGSVSYASPILTWNGDLAVGQTATITYTATVNAADSLGDGTLNNAVTGADNCPDPAITDPTDPDFVADCVQVNDVAAYTVTKSSDANSPTVAGDTITYTVTVENTGGADLTTDNPATFVDDLSGVLDDATYNDDVAANLGTSTYVEPTIEWSGALTAGQTATVTYSVIVNEASADGDGILTNAVVGGDCPDPAITNPNDPGFNADCVNVVAVSEWIATKTSTPAGGLNPGDTVHYMITVENTGGADLTGAEAPAIVDDLTEVLDDATYNNDEDATVGAATYAEPQIDWSNDLAVGQQAVITYSVTVNEADQLTDGILTNTIAGSPNCPTAPITNPDDPAYVEECAPRNYIAAFTVRKEADPAEGSTVHSEDVVTYMVTIENTGALGFTDFTFDDDLSDVLDDARFIEESVSISPESAGTTTLSGDMLTFDGDVAVGEAVTITYAARVNAQEDIGNGILRNVIYAPFSNCSAEGHEDCVTEHSVATSEGNWLADTGRNLFVVLAVAILTVAASVVAYGKWRHFMRV